MRQCLAGMLALTAACMAGCFTAPPDRAVSRYEGRAPFTSFNGDDVVQLDVYLVERPAGDRCINRDVWELTDEEVLGDRKPLLQENGLRAGVLGETPPDDLRALLQSERSCANPGRLRLRADEPARLVVGPTTPELQFQLRQNGRTAGVDLELAQCVLEVTTHFDDGRMAMHFTPAVRHGPPAATPRPVQDPSGTLRWDVQTERPAESYRALQWELNVAPDTYVAVGTLLDRPDTLGQAAFLSDAAPLTQRLLVLRVGRARAGSEAPDGDGKSPPLALQASGVVRGAGP